MRKNMLAVAAILTVVAPGLVNAAAVGAGGMPYSTWLGTFKTSITGEVATIICLVCVIAIACSYAFASAFDGILLGGVRMAIAVGFIGSAAGVVTAMAAGGAII